MLGELGTKKNERTKRLWDSRDPAGLSKPGQKKKYTSPSIIECQSTIQKVSHTMHTMCVCIFHEMSHPMTFKLNNQGYCT